MDTAVLEGLGLTAGEIKVYLTLLELGTVKVGAVIEKSNLQSSVVHNCLHKLTEKGFVSHIKKGKIKYYQAASPDRIIDFIEEKKKRVEEILPELLAKQKLREKEEAEVYEGFKGIKAMYYELLGGMRKGDENLIFAHSKEEYNKELLDFFEKYSRLRKEKGVVVKCIAPKELKSMFEKRGFKGISFKYVDFPVPSGLSIAKDCVALPSWGEKPIGFLIRSKVIAEKYRKYFYRIWGMR